MKLAIPNLKKTNCNECGRYIGPNPASGFCSGFCKGRQQQRLEQRAEAEKKRSKMGHLKSECIYCSVPMVKKTVCKGCKKKHRKNSKIETLERQIKELNKKLGIQNPEPPLKLKVVKKPKDPLSFYYSEKWRDLRFKAMDIHVAKHGRRCILCFASNVQLHVDHIKPRSKYPELEFDLNNLQVLCRECNLGKSNRSESDFRNL